MIRTLRSYVLSRFGRNFIILKYLQVRTSKVIEIRQGRIEQYVRSFVEATQNKRNVHVYYNNAFSPPTYGDFFNVLMLTRFLALSGLKVKFTVLDYAKELHWGFLDDQQQVRFIEDQLSLARYLLPNVVDITINNAPQNISEKSDLDSASLLGLKLMPNGEELFLISPYFLLCLIEKHGWNLPNGFLLDELAEPSDRAYVAWHVRKGNWDLRRDFSADSVKRDFAEIRKLFPNHSIMILSDEKGLEEVFSILAGARGVVEFKLEGVSVFRQPHDGFKSAISLILGSEFYFQRSGGGLGQVPIYSLTPYLQICPDYTGFLGKDRTSLVPWAQSNQTFRHIWGDIDKPSISQLMPRGSNEG